MTIKKGDFIYTVSEPISLDGEKRHGLVMEILSYSTDPIVHARVLWTGTIGATYVPVDTLFKEDYSESW